MFRKRSAAAVDGTSIAKTDIDIDAQIPRVRIRKFRIGIPNLPLTLCLQFYAYVGCGRIGSKYETIDFAGYRCSRARISLSHVELLVGVNKCSSVRKRSSALRRRHRRASRRSDTT